MENIENIQPVEIQFTINNEIKDYLLETSKWGKFLAIVGFIGMALLLLLGVVFIVGFSIFSSVSGIGFPIRIMGFVYILISILYYFPLKYLYNFSIQLKQGLNSINQESVTSGFKNLKSLFRFMGIFTIVVLSIYALIIIVMVPVAIFSAIK
jgi:cell division protein FtsX